MKIRNLTVSIGEQKILSNISLECAAGQMHAIMGPNGSGKSTLVQSLMGDERYAILSGMAELSGADCLQLSTDERAKNGMFLAYQQPPAVPGLPLRTLLKEAYSLLHGPIDSAPFNEQLLRACDLVQLDGSFLTRSLNEGLSGGEKKRCELLQMLILKPRIIMLDEIDSGLDLDGLQMIARVLARVRAENPEVRILLISHNPEFLKIVQPDVVSLMVAGRIQETSSAQLVTQIAKHGYEAYHL